MEWAGNVFERSIDGKKNKWRVDVRKHQDYQRMGYRVERKPARA